MLIEFVSKASAAVCFGRKGIIVPSFYFLREREGESVVYCKMNTFSMNNLLYFLIVQFFTVSLNMSYKTSRGGFCLNYC